MRAQRSRDFCQEPRKGGDVMEGKIYVEHLTKEQAEQCIAEIDALPKGNYARGPLPPRRTMAEIVTELIERLDETEGEITPEIDAMFDSMNEKAEAYAAVIYRREKEMIELM